MRVCLCACEDICAFSRVCVSACPSVYLRTCVYPSVAVVVLVLVLVLLVLVEWLYYSERIIVDKRADLSEFCFVEFRR